MIPAIAKRTINYNSDGEMPAVVKIGFGLAIAYGLYKGGKYYLDKIKAGDDLKAQHDSIIKPPINTKTGKPITLYDLNGKPITGTVNLSIIANDIHQALHSGVTDDEQRAIRAFKRTPVGYVKQLEAFYLKQYGLNLQNDMSDYMDDEEFIQVKFFFK